MMALWLPVFLEIIHGISAIFVTPDSDVYALRDSIEIAFDIDSAIDSVQLTYIPENLTIIDVHVSNSSNFVTLPCENLRYGGAYIVTLYADSESLDSEIIVLHWPKVTFEAPNFIEIHRTGYTVRLSLLHAPCYAEDIEFKLELIFCGPKTDYSCTFPIMQDSRAIYDLYSKKTIEVHYDCKSIGKPGLYFLELTYKHESVARSDPIFAEINEDYLIAVSGEGIFPCLEDVFVEFNHPACISDRDRIRVHSRNVSSLPGYSYVTELPLPKRQRFAAFPCDVFDEAVDEYCFSYVSSAVDGSATDLLEQCVPSWSNTEDQAWTEWSGWSACSASCGQGSLRSRYRTCEPNDKRNLCKGSFVETELCEVPPCYVAIGYDDSFEGENQTCSCGCSLSLSSLEERFIFGSSQFCNGQLFWLLTTQQDNYVAEVTVVRVWSSCNDSQATLQLRDGPSFSSDLLFDNRFSHSTEIQTTSLSNVVLLVFSQVEASELNCTSFFIVKAQAVDVSVVRERFSRWADDSTLSALSPPEIIGMITLVAIFSGIFILAAVYSRFGTAKHADYEKAQCSDFDDAETLVSSVSFDIHVEEHEQVHETSEVRTYVPTANKGALHSLPNTPLFNRSQFSGTLRKSITFSPKSLKRHLSSKEYFSLAQTDVGDNLNDSSLTLHENPLYANLKNNSRTKAISKLGAASLATLTGLESKAVSQAEISRCGTDQDFEMDYYDFNVENATQVPGSNFGTEPALLAWAMQYVGPNTDGYEEMSDIPMEAMSQSLFSTDSNFSTITTIMSDASDVQFADEETDESV